MPIRLRVALLSATWETTTSGLSITPSLLHIMRLSLLGLLVGLLSVVSALSSGGNKLLVIIEEEAEKTKYSQFWSDLQQRGFQITYHSPKDTSLSLFQHGEPAYSHLLLLPVKSKGLGPALTPNLLVEFVNAGSNILLALSAEKPTPAAISSLLLELDISISPDRSSLTVDHFNYDSQSAAENHDVLVISSPEHPLKNVKNFFSVGGLIALPRAVGQLLGNASPFLAPILRAPSTAYTYNPKEDAEATEDPFATGSQLSLVSAFQARNSARFTVLGSAEALEDKWFSASVKLPGDGKKSEKTANQAFAQKLSAWTFKELGVLKVGEIQHYLNEEPSSNPELNPTIYRIKNQVHYSIAVSEWNIDHWTPFTPAAGDEVQLEFSMLSPFHRLNLLPSTTDTNSTTFSADFKLPDQHGIFNFFVEYRRPFLTNVEEKRTVTVRHFAHDEWPRSFVISGAWPWISGVWVTIAGWVVFSALWLYSRPAQEPKKSSVSLSSALIPLYGRQYLSLCRMCSPYVPQPSRLIRSSSVAAECDGLRGFDWKREGVWEGTAGWIAFLAQYETCCRPGEDILGLSQTGGCVSYHI
nr:dolichyl-diphosphooligosaccharide--protein glycosyltransferase subunit wbp1 [Quercus suber]